MFEGGFLFAATIQVKKIERVKGWAATPEKQFVENTPAFRIQANEFAVDDRIPHLQFGKVGPKFIKTFVRVPPTRN
jgi:hypothetical protein